MSTYIRKFRALLKKNETARGLFLVAVVILGAVAVWGGIRFALNTPYPILVVSSPSMCPVTNCVLPVGALVVIKGQDPSTITNQTIIVFGNLPNEPTDFLVIHRVVGIVQAQNSAFSQVSFRTKGDANVGEDGWTPYGYIPGSWVVGVYQFTVPIPYLGSAILAIRDFMYNSQTGQVNPQGILVILALIVGLFAFEVASPGKKDSDKGKEAEAESKPKTDETSASSSRPGDSSSG